MEKLDRDDLPPAMHWIKTRARIVPLDECAWYRRIRTESNSDFVANETLFSHSLLILVRTSVGSLANALY